MQTFLPFADYTKSAQHLDRMRLGKQRVECVQILNALRDDGGWRNHPATLMWENNQLSLCDYAIEIIEEWRRRGYRDKQLWVIKKHQQRLAGTNPDKPNWLGDEEFHSLHRSILLAKNVHYRQFGWLEIPAKKIDGKWPYKWPV